MSSVNIAQLPKEDRIVDIVPGYFLGSVDNALVDRDGIVLTCWAISAPRPGKTAAPAAKIIVLSGERVISVVAPSVKRADIATKFGDQTIVCGARISLNLDDVPKPFVPNYKVFAADEEGKATEISFFEPNDKLRHVQITSASDYMRLLQTPSTRTGDAATLAYTALHCLKRLPRDFSVTAAATCIVGYRVLNKEVTDEELRPQFWAIAEPLLGEAPNIPRGLFIRWHTSVRLIAGYLAFQEHRDDDALRHFEAMTKYCPDLPSWPQSLTNILLGHFLAGYMLEQLGRREDAMPYWLRAPHVFRFGCAVAEFQNYYAYGEIGNALRVAQECYVAATTAKRGQTINNSSIAPIGQAVSLKALPSPFHRLVVARLNDGTAMSADDVNAR